MSEEDFVRWAVGNRVRAEWVAGEVIVMAPSNIDHADLSTWLCGLMRGYVEKRELGLIILDVFARLDEPVPQLRVPDIVFVDKTRLDIVKGTRIDGAPDLVVEIVSPDSQSRDWREKFTVYQAAGVREYWIIDPIGQTVEPHSLTPRGYQRIAEVDGRISSAVIDGWCLRPSWLWRQPRPAIFDLLRELGIQ
jgi:Uma2 family endonuclease